jgi:hypothetical protein
MGIETVKRAKVHAGEAMGVLRIGRLMVDFGPEREALAQAALQADPGQPEIALPKPRIEIVSASAE